MPERYRTQNLYEASYLLARGFDLAGKEASGGKVTLLFKENPKLNDAVMAFYNNGKIEAKKLCDSYRTLKDYVFAR